VVSFKQATKSEVVNFPKCKEFCFTLLEARSKDHRREKARRNIFFADGLNHLSLEAIKKLVRGKSVYPWGIKGVSGPLDDHGVPDRNGDQKKN